MNYLTSITFSFFIKVFIRFFYLFSVSWFTLVFLGYISSSRGYIVFCFCIFIPVLISFALIILSQILIRRRNYSYEKSSPYECGFEPKIVSRRRFSIRFFLIAVLFVVFDVELCLLLPLVYCFCLRKRVFRFLSVLLFLSVIFYGLIHEYREGSLEWVH